MKRRRCGARASVWQRYAHDKPASSIPGVEAMPGPVQQLQPISCRRKADALCKDVGVRWGAGAVIGDFDLERRPHARYANIDRSTTRVRRLAMSNRVLHEWLQEQWRNERTRRVRVWH